MDACVTMYDLVADHDGVGLWSEGGQLTAGCGDSSAGLLLDAECSEQFHNLVIHQSPSGESLAKGII